MNERLTELLPVKVSARMAQGLTLAAGGERKRAEFVRGVLEDKMPDGYRATTTSQPSLLEFISRVGAAVKDRPELMAEVEQVLRTDRRTRRGGGRIAA